MGAGGKLGLGEVKFPDDVGRLGGDVEFLELVRVRRAAALELQVDCEVAAPRDFERHFHLGANAGLHGLVRLGHDGKRSAFGFAHGQHNAAAGQARARRFGGRVVGDDIPGHRGAAGFAHQLDVADLGLADNAHGSRPASRLVIRGEQQGHAVGTRGNAEIAERHAFGQAVHGHLDVFLEAVAAEHQQLDRDGFAAAERGIPRHHVGRGLLDLRGLGQRDEAEIGGFFADDEPVGEACVGLRAVEQVAHLDAISAVFFRLEFADGIVRRRVELRPADARRRIRKLDHVGQFLRALLVLGNLLHNDLRVRHHAEPVGDYFQRVGVALLGFKGEHVHVADGEKTAGHLARGRDFLRLGGLSVRLDF